MIDKNIENINLKLKKTKIYCGFSQIIAMGGKLMKTMIHSTYQVQNSRFGQPIWDGQSSKVYWSGRELDLGDFLMSYSKIGELSQMLENYPKFSEALKERLYWDLVMIPKAIVDYVGGLDGVAYEESLKIYNSCANLNKTQEERYVEQAKMHLQRLYHLLHFDELFKASQSDFEVVIEDEIHVCR